MHQEMYGPSSVHNILYPFLLCDNNYIHISVIASWGIAAIYNVWGGACDATYLVAEYSDSTRRLWTT